MTSYCPLKAAFLQISQDLPEPVRRVLWWEYLVNLQKTQETGQDTVSLYESVFFHTQGGPGGG